MAAAAEDALPGTHARSKAAAALPPAAVALAPDRPMTAEAVAPDRPKTALELAAETVARVKAQRALEPKRVETKFFVGGLASEVSDEELQRHFQQYGDVVEAAVVRDIHTKKSRNFGFVTLRSLEEEEEEVEAEVLGASHEIRQKMVNVRLHDDGSLGLAQEHSSKGSGKKGAGGAGALPGPDELKKVYVGNLELGMDETTLRRAFCRFGAVANVFVSSDRKGDAKKFGFVTFETLPGARAALDTGSVEVQGKLLEIRPTQQSKELMEAMPGYSAYGQPPAYGYYPAPGYSAYSQPVGYVYGSPPPAAYVAAPGYAPPPGAASGYAAPPSGYPGYPPPGYGYPSYGYSPPGDPSGPAGYAPPPASMGYPTAPAGYGPPPTHEAMQYGRPY